MYLGRATSIPLPDAFSDFRARDSMPSVTRSCLPTTCSSDGHFRRMFILLNHCEKGSLRQPLPRLDHMSYANEP